MVFFGGVDQVEHMGADQDGTQFLEIAVVFVFDLGDTPGILATLGSAAVSGLNIFFGTNDGKGHCVDEAASVVEAGVVVFFERRLVYLDILSLNGVSNLSRRVKKLTSQLSCDELTLALNLARSEGLRVSALATTGMRFTRVARRLITSMSSGLREWPVGRMK